MAADDRNRRDRRGGGGPGAGGPRPGGGKAGSGSGGGGSGGGRGGGAHGRAGGRPGRGPQQQRPAPLEVAARTTRNALRRHAESLHDDKVRLGCRSILAGIVGAAKHAESPAEVVGVAEQVAHAVQAGKRGDAQLQATLRGPVEFALEDPRREREVAEMLRLLLRHCYSLAADHVPRQLRDDGSFRASALADVVVEVGAEYLDDAAFARAAN